MRLCECGRQRSSVGGLDYCTGCSASICKCVIQSPAPIVSAARLADLEALREVTEQLIVAADPYRRQFLAEKAETILRRLREPERLAS